MIKDFRRIPGVGKSILQDFINLGFTSVEQLKGRNKAVTGHPRKLSLHIGKNHYELTSSGERRVLVKWSCFFQPCFVGHSRE